MGTIKLEKPVYMPVRFPQKGRSNTFDLMRALQSSYVVVNDRWGVEFHPVMQPRLLFWKKVPEGFTRVFGKVLYHGTATSISFLDLMDYPKENDNREVALSDVKRKLFLTADAEEYLVDKVILPLRNVYFSQYAARSPRETPAKAKFEVKLVISSR